MREQGKLLLVLGVLTPLLAFGAGTATAAEAEGVVVQAKQHYGDQYIVMLKGDVAAAQASAVSLTERFGGVVRSTWSSVHGFSVMQMTEKQARRLAADPA